MSPDPISTGCDPIDDLLDGGLERGAVTQFYGPPAAGKTNIALQTAIVLAADGKTAVYIDTEGVSMDRFEQLVSAQSHTDPEAVASRVIMKDVHDFAAQRDAVQEVEEFASEAELIVLDSATGFYRLQRDGKADTGDALRDVANQVTHLLSIARREDLAVLITNQVFTDPETDKARPLGGHTLGHWTGTIVRLDRFRGGNRRATLEKHRSKPAGETVTFQIIEDGIVGTTP